GHAAATMRRQELLDRLAREIAELPIAHCRARSAEDLQLGIEQTVREKRTERRQKHALRQISRRAKQQQSVRLRNHAVVAFPGRRCSMLHCECGCFMSKVEPFW